MPRRQLYPLPVEDLFSNPAYIALPATGRGMLLSLCEHFWKTECLRRPCDDDQLFAIGRHGDTIAPPFWLGEPHVVAAC
jgi:hypothetical protein